MKRNCPWFLTSDGCWWWENIASQAMHQGWSALMRECNTLVRHSLHANANILASWSLNDAVGASATVTLRHNGYLTDKDGPCAWDQGCGAPPPWWVDGMPAELVRRINNMTFRIARAHYAWAYGPTLREYYA